MLDRKNSGVEKAQTVALIKRGGDIRRVRVPEVSLWILFPLP